MRRLSLRWCFLGLAVFLVTTLSQGTPTTYAAAGSIVPNPAAAYAVVGAAAWHNSNATLTAAADPSAVNIQISDQSYLREGWVVKVDSEQMLIGQLVEGGYGNPDTMVVTRAQGGTSAAAHASGTVIQAKSITVDIWAQDVSDPAGYGLGAFEVDLTFPSNVEMIGMTYYWQWLSSTGRYPDCYPATETWPGSGTWQVSCATENNPGYGQPSWYPPGPLGSGRIAQVTLLPPAGLGLATISLAGSYLLKVSGTDLSATVTDLNVKILACPDVNLDGRINVGDLLIVAKNLGDRGSDTGATILSATDTTQTQIAISDQSLLNTAITGTASAAVTTTNITLTDTRQSWTTDQWKNYQVSCNGKTMAVTGNTANTLTGTGWSGGGDPGNGNAYAVNEAIAIDNEQMGVQTLAEGSPDVMTVVRAYNTSQAATHQAGAHIFRATSDGNYDGKLGYAPTRDVNQDGVINVGDELTVAKVSGITCPSSP